MFTLWQAAEEVPAAEAKRKRPTLSQRQGGLLVQELQHRLFCGRTEAPLQVCELCEDCSRMLEADQALVQALRARLLRPLLLKQAHAH